MKLETRWLPALWIVWGVLVLMAVANYYLQGTLSVTTANMLLHKFKLDAEANIPTWFSSAMLALGGLGWWGLARQVKAEGGRDHWRMALLAGIFLYLSCDETASIHEMASGPIKNTFGQSKIFVHAWVLVGIIPVIIVSAMMLPMLLRLSRTMRNGLLLAGGLYLGGALLVETIGGAISGVEGKDTFAYFVASSIEESMEMAGAIMLIQTLAFEMRRRTGSAEAEAPSLVRHPGRPAAVKPTAPRQTSVAEPRLSMDAAAGTRNEVVVDRH